MKNKIDSLLTPLLHGLFLAPFLLAHVALAQGSGELQDAATSSIDVSRIAGEVRLDGRLDEGPWSKAPVTELPVRTYRPRPEASDLSGRFRLFWREDGLYVAVEVRDDELVLAGDRRSLWDSDSVEVWIDHLWLQAGPAAEGGTLLRWTNTDGSRSSAPEPQAAVAREANGYTVELFVPKALFEAAAGAPMSEGAAFRFAVGLRDRDEGEREAASPLYFPPRFGWNNVESMALAVLR